MLYDENIKKNETKNPHERGNIENLNYEMGEDATKYGEFVATFDSWVTPDQQRKIAERLTHPGEGHRLADMTQEEDSNYQN